MEARRTGSVIARSPWRTRRRRSHRARRAKQDCETPQTREEGGTESADSSASRSDARSRDEARRARSKPRGATLEGRGGECRRGRSGNDRRKTSAPRPAPTRLIPDAREIALRVGRQASGRGRSDRAPEDGDDAEGCPAVGPPSRDAVRPDGTSSRPRPLAAPLRASRQTLNPSSLARALSDTNSSPPPPSQGDPRLAPFLSGVSASPRTPARCSPVPSSGDERAGRRPRRAGLRAQVGGARALRRPSPSSAAWTRRIASWRSSEEACALQDTMGRVREEIDEAHRTVSAKTRQLENITARWMPIASSGP